MAENEVNSDEPEVSGGPPILATLMVVGFIGVVIVVESIIAYMVFPSAAQAAAPTETTIDAPETDEMENEVLGNEAEAVVEVDLGDFTVSAFQPASNSTMRIDFRLFATVSEDNEAEMLAAMERIEHRFREQVLVILRSSEPTDLTDPGLGLIKRKILEKTNRALGTSLLQDIVFSDYSYIEQ